MVGDDPLVDRFFRVFYDRFIGNSDIAQMFEGTDMQHQAAMLKASLFELTSCALFGKPSPELTRLALLHKRRGIDAKMLDEWLAALLDTVETFDQGWRQTTERAWRLALDPGIAYVKGFEIPNSTQAVSGP